MNKNIHNIHLHLHRRSSEYSEYSKNERIGIVSRKGRKKRRWQEHNVCVCIHYVCESTQTNSISHMHTASVQSNWRKHNNHAIKNRGELECATFVNNGGSLSIIRPLFFTLVHLCSISISLSFSLAQECERTRTEFDSSLLTYSKYARGYQERTNEQATVHVRVCVCVRLCLFKHFSAITYKSYNAIMKE